MPVGVLVHIRCNLLYNGLKFLKCFFYSCTYTSFHFRYASLCAATDLFARKNIPHQKCVHLLPCPPLSFYSMLNKPWNSLRNILGTQKASFFSSSFFLLICFRWSRLMLLVGTLERERLVLSVLLKLEINECFCAVVACLSPLLTTIQNVSLSSRKKNQNSIFCNI